MPSKTPYKPGVVSTPGILESGRWRLGDQKFKIILGTLVRTAWMEYMRLCLKNNNDDDNN